MRAEAWFLYDSATGPQELVRETFELGDPGPGEIIAEPLYGSWEGNMQHAVARKPIDVCQHRDEPRVILGNSGVVRVLACGSGTERLRPGDVALLFSGAELDAYGYPEKIWGYDAPGTMGCLATRIRVAERNLIQIPAETHHPLQRWAAFSIRYITAWSSWSLAHRVYRLLVDEGRDPAPNVWGWGGGTTLATIDLARRAGARTAMLSGNAERRSAIEALGIHGVDRGRFADLQFDEAAFARDADARRKYLRSEAAFLACVRERTDGRGVQIFIDNIGGPVTRATQRALSREGVISTCGWKEGMRIAYLRSAACIGRQQYVHSHYATYAEAEEAVDYGERHGWLPASDERVYAFEEIPRLAEDFANGVTGLFPIYRVNGD